MLGRGGVIGCLAVTLIATSARGQDADFFERRIRPILVRHCYECHSVASGNAESGLRLDERKSVRSGGDRGPAIVPGQPRKSLLLLAISGKHPDLKMPPNGTRLPQSVVNDFHKWILAGAPDPRDAPDAKSGPRRVDADEHWAFQPIRDVRPPHHTDESVSDVDRFLLKELRNHDLRPQPTTSPRTLLRRITFDLTGLPPEPKQVFAFQEAVAQRGLKAAFEAEVDRLLAAPEFGERWGRHWLDVARFAESSGREANITFPYAWRYRDYVIDVFNADLPFDQFLTEQIAGDLLPYADDAERTRLLIATGFLAIGPRNLDAMDPRQFAADIVDEQIDASSRVFMASSIACARCHDHKFDPFSTDDYYALAGIFSSSKTWFGTAISPSNRNGGDPLVLPRLDTTPILHRSIAARKVEALKAEKAALERERFEKGAAFTLRDALRVFWRTGAIEGQLEKVDSAGRALPLAMGVTDADTIADGREHLRGEVARLGDTIPRGFPRAITVQDVPPIPDDHSGRLEFAEWLTRSDHPLTSRVIVNRVWSHLFGSGLVPTVDDFGSTGQPPTHPELLDYLALRFMDRGWSMKGLIRELVLTSAYRRSSHLNPASFETDPENRLRWRMPKRRLQAEAIRDAMLLASGELDRDRPVGSLVGRVIGDRPVSLVGLDKRIPNDLDGATHRSVYLPIMRDRLPDVLDVFDFAEPSLVTGQRDTTNVPTQALYLLNSDFVAARAEALADRLLAKSDQTAAGLVHAAYLHCFARPPREEETARLLAFLTPLEGDVAQSAPKRDRVVTMCHALFCTVEFRMVD